MKTLKRKKHQPNVGEIIETSVRREWRHLLKIRDEDLFLFISFIVMLLALIVIASAYIISQSVSTRLQAQAAARAESDPNHILTTGDKGVADGMTVKVSNVGENSQVDPAFTIDDDQTFLTMNVSITNTTAATQNIIPDTQLYVRDTQGDVFLPHVTVFVTSPLQSGTVKPSETVQGQLSFAVPKKLTKLFLYVDTQWNNSAPVVFSVLQ